MVPKSVNNKKGKIMREDTSMQHKQNKACVEWKLTKG